MIRLVRFLGVGLVAGWLADELIFQDRYGLLGNLLLGIIGAVVGGALFDRVGVTRAGERMGCLMGIVASVVGAIVVLLAVRLIGGEL